MRIGLFGGSFNPPHNGHFNLALDFYKASGIEKLIIMPSYLPPHKEPSSVCAQHRFNMTKLAFAPFNKMGIDYTVSDYEIAKKDTSYTYLTVDHLLCEYGEEKLALCVGSDMFLSFEMWKNARELMNKCVIYTKAREEGEYVALEKHAEFLEKEYSAEVYIIKSEVYDASSTQIRRSANDAESKICEDVFDYIKNNGLYK